MKPLTLLLFLYLTVQAAAQNNTGCVHIYFGPASDQQVPDISLCGKSLSGLFSNALSAGYFNNDDYEDLIVGCPGEDYIQGNCGAAYLYLGGDPFDTEADLVLYGTEFNQNFGQSVCHVGDVNGDGFSDLVVCGSKSSLFLGNGTLNNIQSIEFLGYTALESTAGDFNNDGFNDVVLANMNYNNNQGIVELYFGSPSPDGLADLVFRGDTNTCELSASVCMGDINNDSYDDLVVGATIRKLYDFYGRISIYYGSSEPDTIPDVVIYNTQFPSVGEYLSLTDVNADGYEDIVAGAPYDGNGVFPSRTYVYYGGEVMDSTIDVMFQLDENYGFGTAVAPAGDLNDDGFNDILVANPDHLAAEGLVLVFNGGAPMDSLPDMVLADIDDLRCYLMCEILSADINNDGAFDILVSEPCNSRINYDNAENTYLTLPSPAGAFPNPFSKSVTISYSLSWSEFVIVNIFNSSGMLVQHSDVGYKDAGDHQFSWQPGELPEGLYYCRIETEKSSNTIKLSCLK